MKRVYSTFARGIAEAIQPISALAAEYETGRIGKDDFYSKSQLPWEAARDLVRQENYRLRGPLCQLGGMEAGFFHPLPLYKDTLGFLLASFHGGTPDHLFVAAEPQETLFVENETPLLLQTLSGLYFFHPKVSPILSVHHSIPGKESITSTYEYNRLNGRFEFRKDGVEEKPWHSWAVKLHF